MIVLFLKTMILAIGSVVMSPLHVRHPVWLAPLNDSTIWERFAIGVSIYGDHHAAPPPKKGEVAPTKSGAANQGISSPLRKEGATI